MFDDINVTGWLKQADDPRDYLFSATQPTEDRPRPTKVMLHLPKLGYPFEPSVNQGTIGTCGPCTLIESATYCEMAAGEEVPPYSILFLYYCAREIMGTLGQDSGVDNRSLLKAAAKYGLPPATIWPYDISRYNERPPQEVYEAAANNKLVQYKAVPQDLDSLRAAIAGDGKQQGRPVIFGFAVYQSYRSQDTQITGKVQNPVPGEVRIGGHDVSLVGYDDSTRVFYFKNHSGPNWGNNGYGTISYEYALNPNLASDFWVPYTLNTNV